MVTSLKEKPFEEIKVDDLLVSSGVSRSTFYSHFTGKEDVLDSLLDNIFIHVFSASLGAEDTHDFSKESIFDYEHLFTHLFYHFKDEKELLVAITNSSGKTLFCEKMRQKSAPLIERSFDAGLFHDDSLPGELVLSRAKENFVLLILFWFDKGLKDSPETLTRYFLEMNR